jgi:hypothetical protein
MFCVFIKLGFATMFVSTMVNNDIIVVESFGGVNDKLACDVNVNLVANILDIENIHLQCDNDLLKTNEIHFIIIEAQAQKWKAHNMNSIGWGLFVVNNNLYVDLVNTSMLRCIICKSQQIVGNSLNQSFVHKGFIKCNKANGVTPMKIQVNFAHSCLVAKIKLILIEKSMAKHVDLYHS